MRGPDGNDYPMKGVFLAVDPALLKRAQATDGGLRQEKAKAEAL